MNKVTIYTSTLSFDAAGGTIQAWTAGEQRWADVDYSDRARRSQDGLKGGYACVIKMRYDSELVGLAAGARVQIANSVAGIIVEQTYRVGSVELSGINQAEFIILKCEAIK